MSSARPRSAKAEHSQRAGRLQAASTGALGAQHETKKASALEQELDHKW